MGAPRTGWSVGWLTGLCLVAYACGGTSRRDAAPNVGGDDDGAGSGGTANEAGREPGGGNSGTRSGGAGHGGAGNGGTTNEAGRQPGGGDSGTTFGGAGNGGTTNEAGRQPGGGDSGTTFGGAGSGGDPLRDGLIEGSPELCPPRLVSPGSTCEVRDLPCTYAGGTFGVGASLTPVGCHCVAGDTGTSWVCLVLAESDDDCPLEYPPEAACHSGQTCMYAASLSLALCDCLVLEDGAGGEAGAPSSWQCAL